MWKSQGNPFKWAKRAAREESRDDLRWYPWLIPRFNGAFPYRWQSARHKLSVFRRLRGPRLLQCGISFSINSSQSTFQGPHNSFKRQPWITLNYTSLWLLWWMFKKIRKCEYLEIFYRFIWLFTLNCIGWKWNFWTTRRT